MAKANILDSFIRQLKQTAIDNKPNGEFNSLALERGWGCVDPNKILAPPLKKYIFKHYYKDRREECVILFDMTE